MINTSYFNNYTIRIIELDDDINLFVCTDIAKALNYSNYITSSKGYHRDEMTKMMIETNGGIQKMNCFTLKGLRRLICNSRKDYQCRAELRIIHLMLIY